MTWSDGDSRTCLHCGQLLRITGQQALWIHTNDQTGVHTSSHAACGPPWKEHTDERNHNNDHDGDHQRPAARAAARPGAATRARR